MTTFSWKPIYAEIAQRLLSFESRQAELIATLSDMHQRGLKVPAFIDKGVDGIAMPLDEIDPFTFLGAFNRGVTDANRIAIIESLKQQWDLASPLPADFDGLPTLNA